MKVFQLAHNSLLAGHFRRARTLEVIRTRMDWPGIFHRHEKMCSSCPICQKASPSLLTKAPLHPLPIIKKKFQRVAMDNFGPLKRTKLGQKYVLVVVDYVIKWPGSFPLKNLISKTVVNCPIDLTARMGVPEKILTDNGANFISKTMSEFCRIMGIHQIKTSPYYPQTDSVVEHFNSTLKRLLRKLTQTHNTEWDICLPFVLRIYLGKIHSTTGFSPYHLLFGRVMWLPLDELTWYWKGKEETNVLDGVEYVKVLKTNIELVQEMAQKNDQK